MPRRRWRLSRSSHGDCGASRALLAHPIGELSCARLGEEGQDGLARVAPDDGHGDLVGVRPNGLGEEGVGAYDVEGGDAKHAGGVVDAPRPEDLVGDGHCGVDGVLRAGEVERRGAEARTPQGARTGTGAPCLLHAPR